MSKQIKPATQQEVEELKILLDQKNRELEIEAALERVRSTSMAMHETIDLNKVLENIFSELGTLGTDLLRCVIWTFNESDQSVLWWGANPEAESGTETYEIQ